RHQQANGCNNAGNDGPVANAPYKLLKITTYHFQNPRVKIITRAKYSRRPNSMAAARMYFAASGRELKLPAGPTVDPSPGPTLINAVNDAVIAVMGSSPQAANSRLVNTQLIMTQKMKASEATSTSSLTFLPW